MAEWKKIIVSGSEAHLNHVTASKFKGDGSALTGVTATTLGNAIIDGNGIADFSFDASSGATVSLELDGSTLSLGASGVKVADAGVGATQLATGVAGTGIAGGGGTALSVDLNELGAAAVDIANDSIAIIDANDSNATKKESLADIFAAVDGTGLTATAGVLSVDAAQTQITSVGTLAAGAISSGFGNIDNGTSTLNTGVITNASTVAATRMTGSISGSFTGDGSGLTGITFQIDDLSGGTIADADTLAFADDNDSGDEKKVTFSALALAAVDKVAGDVNVDGSGASVIAADAVHGTMLNTDAADGSSIELSSDSLSVKALGVTNGMLAGSIANAKLANDGITIAGQDTSLGGTITADTIIGQISNDTISGDKVEGGTIAATTITALTAGSARITGDLTVEGSTVSAQVANLNVEDRFALFNSGSDAGDGGIVVQTEAGFTGVALGWDDSAARWGTQVDTKLAHDAVAMAPDAYLASVVTGDDATYHKNGNIKVAGGEIFIYTE